MAALLCAGRVGGARDERLSTPFFENSAYGRVHLKASSYFEEPESGTSRAWAKFEKRLREEYHIQRQNNPREKGVRASHAAAVFRIPALPFDDGFVPSNRSEGLNESSSAINSTSSNASTTDGGANRTDDTSNTSSINVVNMSSIQDVVSNSSTVSGVDSAGGGRAEAGERGERSETGEGGRGRDGASSSSSSSKTSQTPSAAAQGGASSASLIRDGERREQVEVVDTEGQVMSSTSRAWHTFLMRVRAQARTNNRNETVGAGSSAFRLPAAPRDTVIKTMAAPSPQMAGGDAGGEAACACAPGQRINGKSCGGGGGGDETWKVFGFYYLYTIDGCMPCRTCLAGQYSSIQIHRHGHVEGDLRMYFDTYKIDIGIYTCIHIHIKIHISTYTCIHTLTEGDIRMYTDTYEDRYRHIHMYTNTYEDSHRCMHMHMHAHTHEDTHCLAGQYISQRCDGTTASDTTVCAPCAACAPGTYLVSEVCGGEDEEDIQECELCPAGSYCAGDQTPPRPCTKSCPRGHVLVGTCEEGAARDEVSC